LVVDDGDLVIAATALLHGLPLVTANTPHFHWITDLNLVNWRDV
jgi:predicted nucleic acid-binding protein